ncbi:hypothetical protein ACS0TY_004521 [Phlomoides rotata]
MFGLLKMRWGILCSSSWYPINTANKIIMARCLIHNYIRNEMLYDPLEGGLDGYLSNQPDAESTTNMDVVESLDTTIEWMTKRDEMAFNMFSKWNHDADGDRAKFVRGHRSWSKIEEDALVLCLTNIKKEYDALSDLLSKSGIGWNSTTSMIEIEDENVWDSCKRADPHVKGIQYKTWPYYPQWIEIFGKDRATGENIADPIDIINELYRSGMDQEGDLKERCVPLTPGGLEKDENYMSKPTDPKRDAMPRAVVVTGDKGSVSSNENRQLNESMKGIDGLKVSDKLKVCDELVQNSKRLEFFLTLPAEEQEEYVWMLLDGRL